MTVGMNGGQPGSMPTALLDVRNLSVSFPGTDGRVFPVVRDVAFQIHRGQRLGVVGESGCGKSMTALAIMGLAPAGARLTGEIRLEGVDLTSLGEAGMQRVRGGRIAMVYQNPLTSLNPLHRVGDQIAEAVRIHSSASKQAAKARAVGLLSEVGIANAASRYGSYPHQFSGGMRQRVMIAMAMATEPQLLIADEVTSALDVTTQARIMELITALAGQHGTAVMFITHDLSVASEFSSDIQVMYAGRIVERSRASDFSSRPVHPYSEALLGALCTLETPPDQVLPVIPGQAPQADELPSGCAFHLRCAYAQSICTEQEPPTTALGVSGDHICECHFARERAADPSCASPRRGVV